MIQRDRSVAGHGGEGGAGGKRAPGRPPPPPLPLRKKEQTGAGLWSGGTGPPPRPASAHHPKQAKGAPNAPVPFIPPCEGPEGTKGAGSRFRPGFSGFGGGRNRKRGGGMRPSSFALPLTPAASI